MVLRRRPGGLLGAIQNVQEIQATDKAFAAISTDGSVISWDNPDDGGDCSVVQDQLRNVRQIQATECAFAAILADGSVVAWGNRGHGGDCSAVQDQLRNVQQIQATRFALQRSWPMDHWLLGAIQTMVVTAPQFRISSETCGIFRQHTLHLL